MATTKSKWYLFKRSCNASLSTYLSEHDFFAYAIDTPGLWNDRSIPTKVLSARCFSSTVIMSIQSTHENLGHGKSPGSHNSEA
jgi:hypothetical protein